MLMKNNTHIPEVVTKLFGNIVKKQKKITINLDAMNSDYPCAKKYFLSSKCPNFVSLQKLASCFPNCSQICIELGNTNTDVTTDLYRDELIQALKEIEEVDSKNQISLKRIIIKDSKHNKDSKKYNQDFQFCRIHFDSTNLIVTRQTTIYHLIWKAFINNKIDSMKILKLRKHCRDFDEQ
eukprot:281737_1